MIPSKEHHHLPILAEMNKAACGNIGAGGDQRIIPTNLEYAKWLRVLRYIIQFNRFISRIYGGGVNVVVFP